MFKQQNNYEELDFSSFESFEAFCPSNYEFEQEEKYKIRSNNSAFTPYQKLASFNLNTPSQASKH